MARVATLKDPLLCMAKRVSHALDVAALSSELPLLIAHHTFASVASGK